MAGGMAILLAMAGMLVFIVAQAAPLWRAARTEHLGTVAVGAAAGAAAAAATGDFAGAVGAPPGGGLAAVALDEYQGHVVMVYVDGRVDVVRLADGAVAASWTVWPTAPAVPGGGPRVMAADLHPERDLWTLALSDGRIVPVEVTFAVTYPGGQRQITPSVRALEALELVSGPPPPSVEASGGEPLRRESEPAGPASATGLVAAVFRPLPDGWVAAGLTADQRVVLRVEEQSRSLLGPARARETTVELTGGLEGRRPTALTVDPAGQYLLVGDADGGITAWNLRRRMTPELIGRVPAGDAPVSRLAFLLGGRSLVAATGDGRVTRWLPVADPDVPGGRRFQLVNEFQRHEAPVVAIGVSRRTKGFATMDASGGWAVHHATTGRTQLVRRTDLDAVTAAALAPRGDGIVLVGPGGELDRWTIDNPHPEVTLGTLFGKVWYEGYDEPAYVWQSSGGSDAFEPKLSLTPLLFGTLKGTLYALLLAVPVAVMGAIYTAHFMEPRWRAIVKPVVELMAGLPSVVLGMLAGLWLAPWMERHFPGVVASGVLAGAGLLVLAALWARFPVAWKNRLPASRLVLVALPLLVLAVWGGTAVGPLVERWFMGGDYRQWLLETGGLRFDQRNSLVVAVAMGFAVIPLVFSISEDALSSVPGHLVSGSLALGATRWETVRRVVLPVAAPAIFSAVMIGFGRAVGETMIVLMATGNTPVMDLGIFTGFRALAANVAVEMSEAPVGGTLYRVLFLSALLLAGVTFMVNTVAEMVRLRLRRRLAQL